MAAPKAATTAVPDIDQVSIPGAGTFAGKNVEVGVSCELMKNQLPGSDIDATTETAVVQDANGQPMIFTIGSDRHLRVLTMPSPSASGFVATDLLVGFPAHTEATAFDVTQDRSGRISLAAALKRADGTGTDVLASALVSDDLAKTDWSAFHKFAVEVSGIDPRFTASAVQIGSSDDDKAPATIVVGAIGEQDFYYRFDDPSAPATKLEFPENVPAGGAGVRMSMGFAFGDRATWFLYRTGQGQTLEATTQPADGGKSLTYDYSPGYQSIPACPFNCATTAPGTQTDPFSMSSDIYVGTDTGVYLFQDAHAGKLTTVTDQLKDVHQVVVSEDTANLSVWAMCSPSELYYVYGKKGPAGYTWNAPILFAANVIHVAPMRSRTRQANELFVVNQDLTVTHHWQDPASTLWRHRTLSVPKTSYVFDAPTFTTVIHVEDAVGDPVSGAVLEVTSSEWFYGTANGLVYSIDIDMPAAVPTDAMGTMTLIALTADIAPPIFHISSGIFDGVINVYPNGGLQKGFARINSGDKLKQQRAAGQPLVDPKTDPGTLAGVADNISRLQTTGYAHSPGLSTSGNTFIVVDPVKHTGAMAALQLPADSAVAMTLSGGVWRAHDDPAAVLAAMPGGPFDSIVDAAGDALHWLEHALVQGIKLIENGVTVLEDGVSFVLQPISDGLQFVLNIGAKVLRIALTAVGAVFKALNWVLKLVGIDLAKVLAWLGHLFGWDDIWASHKVIASMMRSGIEFAVSQGSAELEKIRAIVAEALADAKTDVAKWVLGSHDAGLSPNAVAHQQRSSPPSAAHRSAPGGFALYQLQFSGMLLGDSLTPLTLPTGFGDMVNDVVVPTVAAVIEDLEKDVEDMVKICTDPANTLEDVRKLLVDLVDTVIDPVATLVDGIFKFVEDLVAAVLQALEHEIEIPFLTEFYEFLTDFLGAEEDFTLVNGIALLAAIPFVEICRIVDGEAPFAKGSLGLDSPSLFQTLAGQEPRPALAMGPPEAAAGAAPDDGDDSTPSTVQSYSKWGSLIGALAGIASAVCDVIAWAIERSKKKGKGGGASNGGGNEGGLSVLDLIGIGINILKYAMTFPVPVETDELDWRLQTAAWAIGVAETISIPFIPGDETWKAGAGAVIDTAIMELGVFGDAARDPGWLGWTADIISNISGPVRGIGGAAKEEVTLLSGIGLGWVGAGAGLMYVLVTEGEDGFYRLVNPGG